jgi:biotin carboxylase
MSGHVLIFGGSHSELPLIKAARSLGFKVTTSGNRPEHPGHKLADIYLPADFSSPAQMCEVAKNSDCDFIVSAANDYAYLSACEVAAIMGFPGFDKPEVAYSLHHKNLFKPLAASLGLPVTKFVSIEQGPLDIRCIDGLVFPLVVKPVDLTGGKGITVVKNEESLVAAVAYARSLSNSPSVVIEEFFYGSLHSYSTIIQDGKVVFDYADNEFCSPSPYLVSTSTSQATVPQGVFTSLKMYTEKLASKLMLVDGILHCQFLHRNGNFVILEYTRRCSGDLYSEVVEAVTGIRHAEQFIRQSIGFPIDLTRNRPISEFISRHCVFPKQKGNFAGITVASELEKNILSITEALPRGYAFNEGWREKAAVVIARFNDRQSMESMCTRFNDLINCRLGAP